MKIYSTSEWKKLFKQNETIFKNNLKKVNSAFVAFNANIDLITEIDNSFPIKFNKIKSNTSFPDSVKTMLDLQKVIVHSFVHGKAIELKIENKLLYNDLLQLIPAKQKRMGGQMGIVSNLLTTLGVKNVIIFTNLLSNQQAKLFNKRVLFPSISNNKLVMKKAINVGRNNDPTRTNIIFEFKQGSIIKLQNKTIIIPRNNRFILSSPITKSPPLLPKNLIRRDFFGKIDTIFISGYHHIDEKMSHKIFREWITQLKNINNLNRKTIIHLEYVDLHKKWLNQKLFQVFRHVHSIGLNEVESINIMNYLDKPGFKNKKITSELLVKAGNILMKEFGLKRVNIHTLHYNINLTTKDYPISEEKILHANIFGMRVVNSKGVAGDKFLQTLKTINQYDLNKIGLNAASKTYKTSYNLLIVPNFETKQVPVKYTVGLGDTISSSTLYGELL